VSGAECVLTSVFVNTLIPWKHHTNLIIGIASPGKFQSPQPPFNSQQHYFSPPLRGGDQGEGESIALPLTPTLSHQGRGRFRK